MKFEYILFCFEIPTVNHCGLFLSLNNVAVSARRVELLSELSNSYENISAFPLDVTDKFKCKES